MIQLSADKFSFDSSKIYGLSTLFKWAQFGQRFRGCEILIDLSVFARFIFNNLRRCGFYKRYSNSAETFVSCNILGFKNIGLAFDCVQSQNFLGFYIKFGFQRRWILAGFHYCERYNFISIILLKKWNYSGSTSL